MKKAGQLTRIFKNRTDPALLVRAVKKAGQLTRIFKNRTDPALLVRAVNEVVPLPRRLTVQPYSPPWQAGRGLACDVDRLLAFQPYSPPWQAGRGLACDVDQALSFSALFTALASRAGSLTQVPIMLPVGPDPAGGEWRIGNTSLPAHRPAFRSRPFSALPGPALPSRPVQRPRPRARPACPARARR